MNEENEEKNQIQLAWEEFNRAHPIPFGIFEKIFNLGYYQCCDNHHILYGDDAKRFIEMVENPPPMSEEQKKFLKECEDLIKNNPKLKI